MSSSTTIPPEARWFRDRLARLSGEQLLQIVLALDEQMNNTSLVLLFEVGGKKLLFPGDAQLENWNYALREATDPPTAARARALLAGIDVYKVGHHGSRNATPKQMLWEKLTKRGKEGRGRLRTLLSTMPGPHPGVPRPRLMAALSADSDVLSTLDMKKGVTAPLSTILEVPL